MSSTTEEWRDVVGFESRYEVSSLGRVRSKRLTLPAANGSVRVKKPRVLRPDNRNGYLALTLRREFRGRNERFGVAKLVAMAFDVDGSGPLVDHKNHDKLDNRPSNLRWSTTTQNNQNRRASRRNTSGFKGVTKATKGDGWVAMIEANKKCVYLGTFKTPEAAHTAYCDAARQLHQEFACTDVVGVPTANEGAAA